MRNFIVLSLTILLCSRLSFAQTVKTADGIDQSCFTRNNDMKYYQIIYDEHRKDYISYYQSIRERIIQKLKRNYKDYYSDGDVSLFFILNSKGLLSKVDIDLNKSTSDKRLIDIAILSLQQASPFLPFPKELDAPELPFSVTISFKENN